MFRVNDFKYLWTKSSCTEHKNTWRVISWIYIIWWAAAYCDMEDDTTNTRVVQCNKWVKPDNSTYVLEDITVWWNNWWITPSDCSYTCNNWYYDDWTSCTLAKTSCTDIKINNESATDGTYWIDPDGTTWEMPFQVYCDMTTDWGGWTRILYKNPTLDFEKVSSRTNWVFLDEKCSYSDTWMYCNYGENISDDTRNDIISLNIPINYTEMYYKVKLWDNLTNDLWKFHLDNWAWKFIKFADWMASHDDINYYWSHLWPSLWWYQEWIEWKLDFEKTNNPFIIWTDYKTSNYQIPYLDKIMLRNTDFTNLPAQASCTSHRNLWRSISGTYSINPDWTWAFDVYCDMETDWGGWTRLNLYTRQWWNDLWFSSDPLWMYWERVVWISWQLEISDTWCTWDSQVAMRWFSDDTIELTNSQIISLNNIIDQWYTSEYHAYDTDWYMDWDKIKWCYNNNITMYSDWNEFWKWWNITWIWWYWVDKLTKIFTTWIYWGNAQDSWYNVSLPKYWYFKSTNFTDLSQQSSCLAHKNLWRTMSGVYNVGWVDTYCVNGNAVVCWVDMYVWSNHTCEAVWIWYYSTDWSYEKVACTNTIPINSTYTSSWNWGNNCSFTCDTWYTWTNCENVNIVWDDTSGRNYADGSFAKSCNDYMYDIGNYKYAWATWDWVYWIKPDSNSEFKVYCDMTTDWGGWILAMHLKDSWQLNWTWRDNFWQDWANLTSSYAVSNFNWLTSVQYWWLGWNRIKSISWNDLNVLVKWTNNLWDNVNEKYTLLDFNPDMSNSTIETWNLLWGWEYTIAKRFDSDTRSWRWTCWTNTINDWHIWFWFCKDWFDWNIPSKNIVQVWHYGDGHSWAYTQNMNVSFWNSTSWYTNTYNLTTTFDFNMYVRNTDFTDLPVQVSCLAHKEAGWYMDGIYSINPDWTWAFDVYCDMRTDWGGWTLVARALAWSWDHRTTGPRWVLADPHQTTVAKLSHADIYNIWKSDWTDLYDTRFTFDVFAERFYHQWNNWHSWDFTNVRPTESSSYKQTLKTTYSWSWSNQTVNYAAWCASWQSPFSSTSQCTTLWNYGICQTGFWKWASCANSRTEWRSEDSYHRSWAFWVR